MKRDGTFLPEHDFTRSFRFPMRMISHFHHLADGVCGSLVAIRYFTLECELTEMKGIRIPQVALTLQGETGEFDTESVDPDPELLVYLETFQNEVGVRELLNRLAGKYDGRPMGALAMAAANHLPVGA